MTGSSGNSQSLTLIITKRNRARPFDCNLNFMTSLLCCAKVKIEKFLKCQKFFDVRVNVLCFGRIVGSVVEWLKHRTDDQHGLGSKPARAILLCPWERHFTAHSPAWWFWQAVLNYNHISIKLQADSNILVCPEAGRGNCLPYVLAPPSLSCESGG